MQDFLRQLPKAELHLHIEGTLEPELNGLERARTRAARELDISTALILAFLRDKPVDEAMQLLEAVEPYRERFAAVGLDSAELGYPPGRFAGVFQRARQMGLACVAHAGEEGPPEYIHEALEQLQVRRVDHGVRCLEDPALVETLRERGIVLTLCPLSNVSLKVVERLAEHPLPRLLEAGLSLTLSSDDPAYFGGGMLDNFLACREAFGWGEATFRQLAANAIDEAFMSEARRAELQARLADC